MFDRLQWKLHESFYSFALGRWQGGRVRHLCPQDVTNYHVVAVFLLVSTQRRPDLNTLCFYHYLADFNITWHTSTSPGVLIYTLFCLVFLFSSASYVTHSIAGSFEIQEKCIDKEFQWIGWANGCLLTVKSVVEDSRTWQVAYESAAIITSGRKGRFNKHCMSRLNLWWVFLLENCRPCSFPSCLFIYFFLLLNIYLA